jgi:hypothetical protein
MKSDRRSIFSRIGLLLRGGSKKNQQASKELERLRSEQLRLSSELETLLSSYDVRTRMLADSLVSAESPLSEEDLKKAYEEQLRLWNIVRRLQASDRSVSQLEQEYADWNERKGDMLSELHPDHPSVRMELIASELRSRGKSIPDSRRRNEYEGSAKDANPFEDLNLNDTAMDDGIIESQDDSSQDLPVSLKMIPISAEVQQSLLDQIRECGHQLRKQSAHPDFSSRDLADLYTELRRHHGYLRLSDRRTGTRRYRVALHE